MTRYYSARGIFGQALNQMAASRQERDEQL
jgi:hypothetical protein